MALTRKMSVQATMMRNLILQALARDGGASLADDLRTALESLSRRHQEEARQLLELAKPRPEVPGP